MQPRLHGPEWTAQLDRDLFQAGSSKESQLNHQPMLIWQRRNCPPQLPGIIRSFGLECG